ncbi:MAG: SHOCT domain-containing protein, partial [Nitrososphaeraceae archaeon]
MTAGRPYSEVKKYGDLRQQGILTEEEFQKLKAKPSRI